jgi:hypothetical protein
MTGLNLNALICFFIKIKYLLEVNHHPDRHKIKIRNKKNDI